MIKKMTALTGIVLGLTGVVAAQDAPLPPAPPIHVIGFVDADTGNNCVPQDAVKGKCVERVWFYTPGDDLEFSSFIGCPKDDAACPTEGVKWAHNADTRRAAAQNISETYAALWGVLARRWNKDGDVPQATLIESGYTAMPLAADQWSEAALGALKVALPEVTAWITPTPENPIPLFSPVLYRLPAMDGSGTRPGPNSVLLAGRFAERLGYEGRRYEYNIMDADPSFSGPFFEQIFPFQASNENERPLYAFNRSVIGKPDVGAPVLRPEETNYANVQELGSELFDEFLMRTGSSVARFAMREYTLNQVRILAAVTLMRNANFGEAVNGSRDIVAAARTQTDAEDAITERMSHSEFSLARNFRLNLGNLPNDVTIASVRGWVQRHNSPPEFFVDWAGDILDQVGTRGPQSQAAELAAQLQAEVADPSKGTLRQWLRNQPNLSLDGIVTADTLSLIWRIGLGDALEASDNTQNQEEVRILLDHVQYSILRNIDSSGKMSSPNDVAKIAGSQWQSVLASHSESTRTISQGLGAVDPNAICTTQDGRAALDEASIHPITIDMLMEGPAADAGTIVTPSSLIWENRENLPFILLDDPGYTVPEATQMVGLPGKRAIWRVRWHGWSGWHLLWSLESVKDGTRMSARTSAFCENMVLAEPRLVPTIMRAALLSGNSGSFQPTRARMPKDGPVIHEEKTDVISADDALSGSTSAAESAKSTADAAKEQAAAIKENGLTTDTVSGLAGALKDSDKSEAAALLAEEITDEARYLRDIIYAPLWQKSGKTGMLLFVFDSAADTGLLRDTKPRTPYLRSMHAASPSEGGRELRTTAWTWLWTPKPAADPMLIAPSWRPVQAEDIDTVRPGWRQLNSTDPHIILGGFYLPYREVQWSCSTLATDYDVVSNCDSVNQVTPWGFGPDVLGGISWWMGDRPKLAIDIDAEAMLEMLPAGTPLYNDSHHTFAWMFQPEFGLSFGLRWMPLPASLSTRIGWPWGADRRDGKSSLSRRELGIRTGVLASTGLSGLETTIYGEGWGSFSIRSQRSSFSTMTPYHARLWLAPYGRVAYSFMPNTPDDAIISDYSRFTVLFGVRMEAILSAAPTIPEGG